jgi:hypothetical protein
MSIRPSFDHRDDGEKLQKELAKPFNPAQSRAIVGRYVVVFSIDYTACRPSQVWQFDYSISLRDVFAIQLEKTYTDPVPSWHREMPWGAQSQQVRSRLVARVFPKGRLGRPSLWLQGAGWSRLHERDGDVFRS